MQIIYFLYTWLIFVPVFFVLTILTALTTIIGCLLGGQKVFSYYPGMIWSKLTCFLALCPISVKGRENIQRGQSYVFVSNHQGAFDIFLIYGFIHVPIKWMMKISLMKIPFVGTACRAAGFIFVDNSTPRKAAMSVRNAERCLRGGVSVVVFPEGSRTLDGKMRPFKKGAFQIAVDQHLPIIPLTVNGSFEVLRSGTLRLHHHKMELIIHPAIYFDSDDKSLMESETRKIIAADLEEQYK